MAETNTKLPEEDRPELGRGDLRRSEGLSRPRGDHADSGAGGTGERRSRGDHSGSDGTGGGRPRGEHPGPGGLYNPGGDGAASPSELDNAESGAGLYNPSDSPGFWSRLRNRNPSGSRGWLRSRRNRVIAALFAAMTGGAISLSAFLFLGIFDLPNFMKNVERAAFQRYQVDINGRSTAWLQAYMNLRFGEIEDPNLAPKDRDNVFFRADKVRTNRPLTDWYRTLRASNFEKDLFEREGIRFTSIAERRGASIKYRAGIISFKDTNRRITFDPGQRTFDALARGDPNAFNGALRDFAQVEQKWETDREARKAIREVIRKHHPGWWKAIKRYHLRHDIQNMIGVRKWRFFENTRNKVHEKKIDIRNKILVQALPADSKSGAFIKCLFGVSECRATSDPANPEARQYKPTGNQRGGDKTDGNKDNPQTLGDGSGEETLKAGAGAAGAAGDVTRKIVSKIASRAGLLSLLDSLARFDKAIKDHSLSKFVTHARGAQVAGLFTVFAVAGDQLTTGQQSSTEVNAFMDKFQRPASSEGWTTVIDPSSGSGRASAAGKGYTKAKNKKEFCSTKHQAEMRQNPEQAEREFQYQCPKDKVGGPTKAQELEESWNNGPGLILHPFLSAYHAATGGIFDVFNSIADAVISPVVSAVLSVTGTADNVEDVVAFAGAKALEFGGAVLGVDQDTPSGQVANYVIEGGAVTAEAAMRDQGAARTNSVTRALAENNLIAYQAEERRSTGFFDRYLALSNPRSLASTELFALSNTGISDIAHSAFRVFASALSGPLDVLTQPTHAARTDGYAAARFAGIETYDLPRRCLGNKTLDMTPIQATNADDMGLFKPEELNWELMSNKENWYDALYEKADNDEKVAKKVWNCALFDNTVRGGIGAPYGYKGEDAFESGGGGGGSSGGGGVTVTGNAKQIAQDILANKNISYAFSAGDDVRLVAQGKPGTNGAPIDIRLLQMVAALGKHHKVVVTAFESYGQGHSAGSDHYSGHAVDLDTIDGAEAYQTITDYWDIIKPYSKGAVFLQGDCPGAKPAPQGMDRQPGDACNHQHISVGPAD
ncbi:MAG TPA: hypothetical protein VFX84_00580 [Candidatus Saccharimonadales bacterium]|nr:hypothetical protein [Candidatus Saccharimonadales bacterium]